MIQCRGYLNVVEIVHVVDCMVNINLTDENEWLMTYFTNMLIRSRRASGLTAELRYAEISFKALLHC